MDNLKIIYKILKELERALDYDEFDAECISAETLKISEPRLNALLCMLANDGYIEGVNVRKFLGSKYPQAIVRDIRITLKGIEYLSENSVMKKLSEAAKGIAEII